MRKCISIVLATVCTAAVSGCYYGGTKQNIGMATGGALGGYVGSQIGSGSGQLAATAAGAVVGALLGGSIGRSMEDLDRVKAERALESTRTGYGSSWTNPDTGHNYTMTPTRTYQTADGPCREFTTRAYIDGRSQTVSGTACRQPDGSWTTIN